MSEKEYRARRLADLPFDVELTNELKAIFYSGEYAVFRDGYDSVFSRDLIVVLNEHGEQALAIIDAIITVDMYNDNVLSESLQVIGEIPGSPHLAIRWQMLCKWLDHFSSVIRCGAIHGLAALGEVLAIRHVTAALEREQLPLLKKLLDKLLEQLQAIKERRDLAERVT